MTVYRTVLCEIDDSTVVDAFVTSYWKEYLSGPTIVENLHVVIVLYCIQQLLMEREAIHSYLSIMILTDIRNIDLDVLKGYY